MHGVVGWPVGSWKKTRQPSGRPWCMCVHACMCRRPPSLEEQAVCCAYRSPQCRGPSAGHRRLPSVVPVSSSHLAEHGYVCMLCSWSLSCLLEALGQACEGFPAVPVHIASARRRHGHTAPSSSSSYFVLNTIDPSGARGAGKQDRQST